MCGIVGVLGRGPVAGPIVDALKRLEYRGYDSAGVATLENGRLERRRAEGKLKNLEAKLAAEPLGGRDRHRTYALGDPRQADGRQRPSARFAPARRRPQRHHRELQGAARGARRQGIPFRHRDRFRDRRVRGRGRAGAGQDARAGGPRRASPAARRVRAGLSVRGRGRPPDRRAAGRAARDRLRRRRDVSGLRRARARPLHRSHLLSRGGRLGSRDARRRRHPRPRRETGQAPHPAEPCLEACSRRRATIATSWPRRSTSSPRSSDIPSPITSTWRRCGSSRSPGRSTRRSLRESRSSHAAPPIWPGSRPSIGSSGSRACRSRSMSPRNTAIARRRSTTGA